jgi:hypothetical protein
VEGNILFWKAIVKQRDHPIVHHNKCKKILGRGRKEKSEDMEWTVLVIIAGYFLNYSKLPLWTYPMGSSGLCGSTNAHTPIQNQPTIFQGSDVK